MNSALGREVSSPGRGYPGEAERGGEERGTNGNRGPPRSAEAGSTSALRSRAPPSSRAVGADGPPRPGAAALIGPRSSERRERQPTRA